MKLKTTLLAVMLAAFATSSAFAVDEAAAKKTETPAAEKPVKRHNHMEEKTGMPMNAPKAQGESHDDAHADKAPTKKHFHPTDR